MKKFFSICLIAVAMVMAGCGLVPDSASQAMFGWMKTPPGYVPNDRIDVYNNVEGTYMMLSDRGGDKPEHIPTGAHGWIALSTYFGSDGYDHANDNTITASFYDAATGKYLGLAQYEVYGGWGQGGPGYRAVHFYYEPVLHEYKWN